MSLVVSIKRIEKGEVFERAALRSITLEIHRQLKFTIINSNFEFVMKTIFFLNV